MPASILYPTVPVKLFKQATRQIRVFRIRYLRCDCLVFLAHGPYSRRLDLEGVTHISARGLKQLLWKDVASISRGHQGPLKLSDDRTTIIIMPMLYYGAGGVDRWIRDRNHDAPEPKQQHLHMF